MRKAIPPILTVACYVLGDERREVFPIEVDSTKTVGALRKAIVAEDVIVMRVSSL